MGGLDAHRGNDRLRDEEWLCNVDFFFWLKSTKCTKYITCLLNFFYLSPIFFLQCLSLPLDQLYVPPHPQLSTPFNTSTFIPSTQSTLCIPHPQLATWHSLQYSPLYSTQTHSGPLLVPWHDLDFMLVTFDLDFVSVRYWLRLCISHTLDIDSGSVQSWTLHH